MEKPSAPVVPQAGRKDERVAAPVKEVKPAAENPTQPMFSDFGLYECLQREKMVMGYEKERHSADVHNGV